MSEEKLDQIYEMTEDFDEYFTLQSIMKLGVNVKMEDIAPEKMLLFCHINGVINGK